MVRRGVMLALGVGVLAGGGCAQLGLPEAPEAVRRPSGGTAAVYVVYHPRTVLGFGHTGVVVRAGPDGPYERFDQYASAEVRYNARQHAGETAPLEGSSARVPSVLGFTRERVFRQVAQAPERLLRPAEWLVPVVEVQPGPVLRAARKRWRTADALEAPTARRYSWLFNNCQTFTRAVLREGGAIPERYFPKHFVADLLTRWRAAGQPEDSAAPPGES